MLLSQFVSDLPPFDVHLTSVFETTYLSSLESSLTKTINESSSKAKKPLIYNFTKP